MLLVIESPNPLDSDWVLHEINIAKINSLGIFALQAPGAKAIPSIDSGVRMCLSHSDFDSGSFSATSGLLDTVLAAVVERANQEHGRALIRRRQILYDSLEGALAAEGVPLAPRTPEGTVAVTAKKGTQYLVWLTPRPPELSDFHTVHGATVAPAKGCHRGLIKSDGTLTIPADDLARRSVLHLDGRRRTTQECGNSDR